MYQTYDVTELINEGANGMSVTLASGWWCDAQTFVLRNYNYYGDRESFLAKLDLIYEDGSRTCHTTNTSDWNYYGEGPYLYAGLFQEHGTGLEERRRIVEPLFSIVKCQRQSIVVIGDNAGNASAACGEVFRHLLIAASGEVIINAFSHDITSFL